MKIVVTSVFVDDQEKALDFYTRVLGFQKKADVPVGPGARWLTVVGEDRDGVELLLEPEGLAEVGALKRALFERGIPAASFGVADVKAEHARLVAAGVVSRMEPTFMGAVTVASFEDGCGNVLQIAQRHGE